MSTKKMDAGKLRGFFVPLIIGLVIWFWPWVSPDLPVEGLRMFAIFIATIVGIIMKPLPMGAVALIGMSAALMLGVVDRKTALSGFSSGSVWLVVFAFFISKAITKSGLGNRLAFIFVKRFGKKTLSLVYALFGVDLIIGPSTPSSTARVGGIMAPIVSSIADSYGSYPNEDSRKKVGSYLMQCIYHGDSIIATMFLTAGASKPLAQGIAATMGVEITWMNWFLGALVPGLISLALIPVILMKLEKPEVRDTPNAPEWAEKQLQEMGPMTSDEKWTTVVFVLALGFWMTGNWHSFSSQAIAMTAVSILLIVGVIEWSDVTGEKGAWNTLMWFAILVMMAGQLTELGFIPWFSETIANLAGGMSWQWVFLILCLVYFYSHYMFASLSAHVTAMYPAFLGVAIAAGTPPLYAALMLGYVANICTATTHYASGPSSVIFGMGYSTQNEWWKNSFVMGLVYLIVWVGLGSVWMNLIGLM